MIRFDRQSSAPNHFRRLHGGSRELNEELQTKASELERLFAAHKLRAHGNQPKGSGSGGELDGRRSQGLRGELYERYMRMRDAKLRGELGGVKRAQEEAKMKAMHDWLERCRAELQIQSVGSDGDRNWALESHRRVEEMRGKDQQTLVEALPSEEEEDRRFSDGSSKSINSRKLLATRSASSSTSRHSGAAMPRPSINAPNSGSIKRRIQSATPLAQSLPNFSDFRKENTKPSAEVSKGTIQSPSRNFGRSKSTTEGARLVKEVKPPRARSMRRSSLGLSPLNSDKLSKEKNEQIDSNVVPKTRESKPFLRKGNGKGAGAGLGVAKLKASVAPESMDNGEESTEWANEKEVSLDMDFSIDGDKPRMSGESGNSDGIWSQYGEVRQSSSRTGELSSVVSSKFNGHDGNLVESPSESLGSWNSHAQNSFSYVYEQSDFDALVGSPGSPASWNSHETVRTRKKWGAVQNPILASNSSHQSPKDEAKGFKRLLQFGKKSRCRDSVVTDCVSTSTPSECVNHIEDGYDQKHQSSEDLRSTKGYSLPAYDGFIYVEVLPEEVQSPHKSNLTSPTNFKSREDHLSGNSPRGSHSFFSLSSLRNKGTESKLR